MLSKKEQEEFGKLLKNNFDLIMLCAESDLSTYEAEPDQQRELDRLFELHRKTKH